MNPTTADIEDRDGAPSAADGLRVVKAWLEFVVAAVVAVARVISGKDQSPELISAPSEVTEPVAQYDDANEEIDGAR